MRRGFRKPLIMMTPKSLLRHKLAVSSAADFTGESHFRRILSDLNPPADGETRRLVLCSGKLAYELMEARDAAGDLGVEIVRIEQLYPFPSEPLVKRLNAMPNLEAIDLGAGRAEEQRRLDLRRASARAVPRRRGLAGMRPHYAGRDASASPATGLAKRHAAEQAALIAAALGHSSRGRRRCRGAIKGKHGH